MKLKTLCACLTLVTYAGMAIDEPSHTEAQSVNKGKAAAEEKNVLSLSNAEYGQWIDAAKSGNIDVIQSFIDRRINVDETRGRDGTALWCAAENGHVDAVRLLLDNGADVNYCQGFTVLAGAVEQAVVYEDAKSLDIVKLLLDKGADPNKCDKVIKKTPLICAMGENWRGRMASLDSVRLKVVKMLLKKEADPDIGRSLWGENALMLAIKRGQTEIAKLLLEPVTNYKKPVLDLLYDWKYKHGRSSEYIKEHKESLVFSDLNAQDDYGRTALIHAVRSHDAKIVKLLLEKGANPNVKDDDGKTAFDYAEGKEIIGIMNKFKVSEKQSSSETENLSDSFDIQNEEYNRLMSEDERANDEYDQLKVQLENIEKEIDGIRVQTRQRGGGTRIMGFRGSDITRFEELSLRGHIVSNDLSNKLREKEDARTAIYRFYAKDYEQKFNSEKQRIEENIDSWSSKEQSLTRKDSYIYIFKRHNESKGKYSPVDINEYTPWLSSLRSQESNLREKLKKAKFDRKCIENVILDQNLSQLDRINRINKDLRAQIDIKLEHVTDKNKSGQFNCRAIVRRKNPNYEVVFYNEDNWSASAKEAENKIAKEMYYDFFQYLGRGGISVGDIGYHPPISKGASPKINGVSVADLNENDIKFVTEQNQEDGTYNCKIEISKCNDFVFDKKLKCDSEEDAKKAVSWLFFLEYHIMKIEIHNADDEIVPLEVIRRYPLLFYRAKWGEMVHSSLLRFLRMNEERKLYNIYIY